MRVPPHGTLFRTCFDFCICFSILDAQVYHCTHTSLRNPGDCSWIACRHNSTVLSFRETCACYAIHLFPYLWRSPSTIFTDLGIHLVKGSQLEGRVIGSKSVYAKSGFHHITCKTSLEAFGICLHMSLRSHRHLSLMPTDVE